MFTSPPCRFAQSPLIMQPEVMQTLSHPGVLGDNLALHSLGCALGEAGALAQSWHKDNPYLFGADALATSGVASGRATALRYSSRQLAALSPVPWLGGTSTYSHCASS